MPVHVLDSLPGGDFDTYRIPPNQEDGSLQGRLLIQVAASGRLEDHFRIVFGGGQHPSVSFSGRKISTHPIFGPYNFHLEADPENVDIKTNAFVSKWEDLESMVASDRLAVSTEELQDANQHFREAWEAAKKTSRPPAAALRWSAQANSAYGFKLALQALPASSRALRKDARLAKDTTRTVELAAWTAVSPMAKEGSGNGPIPISFSPDPAATRTNLSAHPDRLSTGKKTIFHKYRMSLGKCSAG